MDILEPHCWCHVRWAETADRDTAVGMETEVLKESSTVESLLSISVEMPSSYECTVADVKRA